MFNALDNKVQSSTHQALDAIAASGIFVPVRAYELVKNIRATNYIGKTTHEIAQDLIQLAKR